MNAPQGPTNSDSIFEAIEVIAAEPSKKTKEHLIRSCGAFPEFRQVLLATLDPSVTYGVKEIPQWCPSPFSGHHLRQFNDYTWQILTGLATRELTGNAALTEIVVERNLMTKESAELFRRIITKDLRAGFSASTVNKALPGLIPTFPYMRCSLPKDADLEAFPWEKGCFSQTKMDGEFANLNKSRPGHLLLASRQGSRYPLDGFSGIEGAAACLMPGTQTHGELLVVYGKDLLPREESNGILNSVLQGGEFPAAHWPLFVAWDQIPLSEVKEKGKCYTPYARRLASLSTQLDTGENKFIKLIDSRTVHSIEEAFAHFRELLAQRKEGTIVKSPDGPWLDGTSKFQVKLKGEFECDLKVKGFNPGEGKNAATFGSIVCGTADGLLEVGVSGMSDAVRRKFHESREELIREGIITVRANGIMEPSNGGLHSLFLPRYVALRADKSEADSLARVKAQFEAAIGVPGNEAVR